MYFEKEQIFWIKFLKILSEFISHVNDVILIEVISFKYLHPNKIGVKDILYCWCDIEKLWLRTINNCIY